MPKLRTLRVKRPAQSAPPAVSPPGGNLPSRTPSLIVKALAWIILAVIVAAAAATGLTYLRLRGFQARLTEVDALMTMGSDTAALNALREMAEPAVRHGLLVREVGTRTVRVLVRLGRNNEAEDAADALATLVPPDDAEPWNFASPQSVLSLPQWAAGDVLYGAEKMTWDRWAGYRELLAILSDRDRLEMEKARVLLAARHPNNPLCPGKPKPVIRETNDQPDRTDQSDQSDQTDRPVQKRLTKPARQIGPKFSPAETEAAPPPQTAVLPTPPPPEPVTVQTEATSAPAATATPPQQESVRGRAIRQLHDRQSAIQAQLKSLHASADDSVPVERSAAQKRLDLHRAEMQKVAKRADSSSGAARTRALDQLRQMKYREMQLEREAGPAKIVPAQQVVTRQVAALRSELAGIEEQLNALESEPKTP